MREEGKSNPQESAPLFEAVRAHINDRVVPFHVPAHKHGTGLTELRNFCGENMFQMDLNSMRDIDDLSNPVAAISEAQKLAADAFKAERAFFLVGGATSGIHTMLLSALRPGDRIILPRNCHKSAFSGLILSGAVPVYARVAINEDLGIAMMATREEVEACFRRSPQAAALFLLNPNYYGFTGDLPALVDLAREWEAVILVDEAHGGHMLFHPDLPGNAMQAGADMSVISMHKTCGSLTQSAILLIRNEHLPYERIVNTLNLQRTTSASYLLMVSLDLARKRMATQGRELLEEILAMARSARSRINAIEGLYAFGPELVDGKSIFGFDDTKLSICVSSLGMTGFEMERRLREEYHIQVELADLNNIMAIITTRDDNRRLDLLIEALKSIALQSKVGDYKRIAALPDMPETIVIPRDAFYSHKKQVTLEKSVNEICGEMVMSYPPGIPVICPGERITQEIVDYITILKENNCHLQGAADPYVNYIRILGF